MLEQSLSHWYWSTTPIDPHQVILFSQPIKVLPSKYSFVVIWKHPTPLLLCWVALCFCSFSQVSPVHYCAQGSKTSDQLSCNQISCSCFSAVLLSVLFPVSCEAVFHFSWTASKHVRKTRVKTQYIVVLRKSIPTSVVDIKVRITWLKGLKNWSWKDEGLNKQFYLSIHQITSMLVHGLIWQLTSISFTQSCQLWMCQSLVIKGHSKLKKLVLLQHL